jgi:hypothetical protein
MKQIPAGIEKKMMISIVAMLKLELALYELLLSEGH